MHICVFDVNKMRTDSLAMRAMQALPQTMLVRSWPLLIGSADAMHRELKHITCAWPKACSCWVVRNPVGRREHLRAANSGVDVHVLSTGLRDLAAEELGVASRRGLVCISAELAVVKRVVVWLVRVVIPVEAKDSNRSRGNLHKPPDSVAM